MSIFKMPSAKKDVDTLISKMRKIVSIKVPNEKFRKDFEINDKHRLQRCEGTGVFAWYVYDFGTHLFQLNNIEEVRCFQRDWLDGMKQFEGKKKEMEEALYVLNVRTGDFRRVYDFKSCADLPTHLLQKVN